MGKTVTKLPEMPRIKARKRVCAYARVSSGKDAMLHSLSAQVSWYRDRIRAESGWEYAGVYADEAVTGTRAERAGFQRMLSDCRDGKIDLILTTDGQGGGRVSCSRFLSCAMDEKGHKNKMDASSMPDRKASIHRR